MDFRTLGRNQIALAFQGRAFEPRVAHRSDVLVPSILLIATEKIRPGQAVVACKQHTVVNIGAIVKLPQSGIEYLVSTGQWNRSLKQDMEPVVRQYRTLQRCP